MLSIAVLCLVGTLVTAVPLKSTDFDHYVFTRTYPAGMCYCYSQQGKGYECSFPSNASTWTIHGLWPTEENTRGPNYCKNTTFDPNAIASLVPQLVAKWPNVLNTTGFYCFWAHEFEKHGTCSGLTEYNFFKKVLGIFDDLPSIGNAFNNAGVVPSNQHTHDGSKLLNILTQAFGVPPVLGCTTIKGGVQILSQVELCLDKQFQPMKCPDSTEGCTGDILYPQYSPYNQH